MNTYNELPGRAEIAVQAGAIAGGIHLHTTPPRPAAVPRQLPAPPRHWIDRRELLAALTRHYDQRGPVVEVLSGLSGSGKTALGVQWVHTQRARFTDGELYADLSEVDTADVLACWLRALGHRRLPHSLPELTLTYRSAVADLAVAMLIDNAARAHQVVPLLPASRRSAVIITSQAPLPELLCHGARLHRVEPLLPADTKRLIRAYARDHAAEFDDATADLLARTAGGLPLHAVLAAGRFALPAAGTVQSRNQINPSPREVPDMSYDALPAQGQSLYRRIGDHPSRRITVDAAAAMLDTDTTNALEMLEILRDAGIVDDHDGGYSIPQAVQKHARTLADRDDEPGLRQDARARVTRAYLSPLVDADFCLNPGPRRYNPAYSDLVDGSRQSRFAHPDEARTWFNTNLGTLRGLIRRAYDDGNYTLVWQLAEASRGGHLKGRHNQWLVDTHEIAVDAAVKCDSPWASLGYSRLSWGYRNTGRVDEARTAALTARRLAVKAGDEWAESAAWSAEGRAFFAAEEYHLALERFRQSLLIAERIDDVRSVALRLRHIAECLIAMDRYAEACEYLQGAATRMESIGFGDGYAMVLVHLADARIAAGHADVALEEMHSAWAIMRESGSDAYVAEVLARLAAASEKLGRTADARHYYTEARARFTAVDDHDNTDRMTAALAAL